MAGLPDPYVILNALNEAILYNKRPSDMLHKFLTSGTPSANLVANKLLENKESLKVLTSSKGRAWVIAWLKDLFDYLQIIAESS